MVKVFVTGASGFIGSAVVDELVGHGYQVLGLARSETSAEKLTAKEVEVLRGDLEDLESIKKGVEQSDAVIHLAFHHDFTDFEKGVEIDSNVSKAIVESIKGTDKKFVYTSALGSLADEIGVKSDEDSVPNPKTVAPLIKRRYDIEQVVLNAAKSDNVNTNSVRLPAVHGKDDPAFISNWNKMAQAHGVSYYYDEGKTTWPAVHVADAAVLYRLALEKGKPGRPYHAVHEEAIESKTIAEVIAEKNGLKAESLTFDQLEEKFGFLGFLLAGNVNVSSKKTREELGWVPKEVTLLEDLKLNY